VQEVDTEQTAWIQRLRAIADWLWREARRRAQRRKRTSAGIYFVERDNRIRVCHRRAFEPDSALEESGGREFCTVSVYPRVPWVLLALTGEVSKTTTPVIVYFGYRPELDVTGANERETRGKRRRMRAILRRARNEGKLSAHTMCIDGRTTIQSILEQLAIILAQKGVFDETTQEVLGLRSSSPVTRAVGSLLVQRFIDPSHPASFQALKKKLRRDVAGPEHAPKTTPAPTDWGSIDDNALAAEDHKKIPPRVTQAQHDYSVRRAAEIVGLPQRTLYQRIQQGKFSTRHDRFGRIRLSAAELEILRGEERDRETKRALVRLLAERYHISDASARRHIKRALKKGKTIKQIFIEARGIE